MGTQRWVISEFFANMRSASKVSLDPFSGICGEHQKDRFNVRLECDK